MTRQLRPAPKRDGLGIPVGAGGGLFQYPADMGSGWRLDWALGVALSGGLALGAAFPEPGWASLAWLAPGLMLLPALGCSGWLAYGTGYGAGLVFHLFTLAWLLRIPFPLGAVAGWLALGLFLALFQGAWVWGCLRLAPRGHRAGAAEWTSAVDAVLAVSWWRRTAWTLGCAGLWVALEMVQARIFSGFPWDLMGVTQFRMVPLIQVAAWTGVYGVSFLVVWVSLAVGLAMLRLLRRPGARWDWMLEVRLPLLLLLAACALGLARLGPAPSQGRTVRLALIQPSIPQAVIWDHREDSNRFAQLMELTRLALTTRPDLVVWPEAAMPAFTAENYQAITNLCAEHRVEMIFGADDAEPRRTAAGGLEYDYYNAGFLVDAAGRYVASYRKQRLVIFGEYVPLSGLFPFLRHLTPIEGGFTPGAGPVNFALESGPVVCSVLICFEDVFPHGARPHVNSGVDFLLNLTNDGWFGRGSAQWQHAAIAVFRAVENGRPLVRCTNNGLTCWVDAQGRLRRWLGQDSGDIHGQGFLTLQLWFPPKGVRSAETFYHRRGDLFGWVCVGVLTTALLGSSWRRSLLTGRAVSGRREETTP